MEIIVKTEKRSYKSRVIACSGEAAQKCHIKALGSQPPDRKNTLKVAIRKIVWLNIRVRTAIRSKKDISKCGRYSQMEKTEKGINSVKLKVKAY